MEAQSATTDTQASGPEGQHGPAGQDGPYKPLHAEASQSEQNKPKDFNAVHCMVPGCGWDLSEESAYHRRHRVCPGHLKAPIVELDGADYRFCQQCGRFQVLSDFQDSRRSCEAALRAHNARRRTKKDGSGWRDRKPRTNIKRSAVSTAGSLSSSSAGTPGSSGRSLSLRSSSQCSAPALLASNQTQDGATSQHVLGPVMGGNHMLRDDPFLQAAAVQQPVGYLPGALYSPKPSQFPQDEHLSLLQGLQGPHTRSSCNPVVAQLDAQRLLQRTQQARAGNSSSTTHAQGPWQQLGIQGNPDAAELAAGLQPGACMSHSDHAGLEGMSSHHQAFPAHPSTAQHGAQPGVPAGFTAEPGPVYGYVSLSSPAPQPGSLAEWMTSQTALQQQQGQLQQWLGGLGPDSMPKVEQLQPQYQHQQQLHAHSHGGVVVAHVQPALDRAPAASASCAVMLSGVTEPVEFPALGRCSSTGLSLLDALDEAATAAAADTDAEQCPALYDLMLDAMLQAEPEWQIPAASWTSAEAGTAATAPAAAGSCNPLPATGPMPASMNPMPPAQRCSSYSSPGAPLPQASTGAVEDSAGPGMVSTAGHGQHGGMVAGEPLVTAATGSCSPVQHNALHATPPGTALETLQQPQVLLDMQQQQQQEEEEAQQALPQPQQPPDASAAAARYQQHLVRLSVKLHGLTPDQLPSSVVSAMQRLLSAHAPSMDAVMSQPAFRQGCVQMEFDILVNCRTAGSKHGQQLWQEQKVEDEDTMPSCTQTRCSRTAPGLQGKASVNCTIISSCAEGVDSDTTAAEALLRSALPFSDLAAALLALPLLPAAAERGLASADLPSSKAAVASGVCQPSGSQAASGQANSRNSSGVSAPPSSAGAGAGAATVGSQLQAMYAQIGHCMGFWAAGGGLVQDWTPIMAQQQPAAVAPGCVSSSSRRSTSSSFCLLMPSACITVGWGSGQEAALGSSVLWPLQLQVQLSAAACCGGSLSATLLWCTRRGEFLPLICRSMESGKLPASTAAAGGCSRRPWVELVLGLPDDQPGLLLLQEEVHLRHDSCLCSSSCSCRCDQLSEQGRCDQLSEQCRWPVPVMSPLLPVVVCPSAAVAEEVSTLLAALDGSSHGRQLVMQLGLLLDCMVMQQQLAQQQQQEQGDARSRWSWQLLGSHQYCAAIRSMGTRWLLLAQQHRMPTTAACLQDILQRLPSHEPAPKALAAMSKATPEANALSDKDSAAVTTSSCAGIEYGQLKDTLHGTHAQRPPAHMLAAPPSQAGAAASQHYSCSIQSCERIADVLTSQQLSTQTSGRPSLDMLLAALEAAVDKAASGPWSQRCPLTRAVSRALVLA